MRLAIQLRAFQARRPYSGGDHHGVDLTPPDAEGLGSFWDLVLLRHALNGLGFNRLAVFALLDIPDARLRIVTEENPDDLALRKSDPLDCIFSSVRTDEAGIADDCQRPKTTIRKADNLLVRGVIVQVPTKLLGQSGLTRARKSCDEDEEIVELSGAVQVRVELVEVDLLHTIHGVVPIIVVVPTFPNPQDLSGQLLVLEICDGGVEYLKEDVQILEFRFRFAVQGIVLPAIARATPLASDHPLNSDIIHGGVGSHQSGTENLESFKADFRIRHFTISKRSSVACSKLGR